MQKLSKPLIALVLVLLVAAACGGADEISTGAGDDVPDSPDGSQDPVMIKPDDLRIIGSANIGGEIVDPQPHEINDLLIAESYPEQLQLSFIAGDVNCLAATATAADAGDTIIVSLEVGVTTDALAKSCLAGEFEHRMSIALEEGLDGREVVLSVVPDGVEHGEDEGAPIDGPPAQSFEESLVGLSEAAAQDEAASSGYTWRVLERDGEAFMGTTDYSESRINVAISDGVVIRAWIG